MPATTESKVTAGPAWTLKCDMCGKPLKSRRFQISAFMRPERAMTVGPDCYKKEKEAVAAMKARHTPEQLDAIRTKIADSDRSALLLARGSKGDE